MSIKLQGSDSEMLGEIDHGTLAKRRSLFFKARAANQAGGIQTSNVKKGETVPSETEGPATSQDKNKLPCVPMPLPALGLQD